MSKLDATFRILNVLCLHDPFSDKYSYIVETTGGGLNYFFGDLVPPMVTRFLQLHNEKQYCVFLDWHNYIVYAEPVPFPK